MNRRYRRMHYLHTAQANWTTLRLSQNLPDGPMSVANQGVSTIRFRVNDGSICRNEDVEYM